MSVEEGIGAKIAYGHLQRMRAAQESLRLSIADVSDQAHDVVNRARQTDETGFYKVTEFIPLDGIDVSVGLKQLLCPPDNRIKAGLFFRQGEIDELVAVFGQGNINMAETESQPDEDDLLSLSDLIDFVDKRQLNEP